MSVIQAKAPPSYFPAVPAADQKDYYDAVIDGARKKYNDHYADYSQKPKAIENLTPIWTERHSKLTKVNAAPVAVPAAAPQAAEPAIAPVAAPAALQAAEPAAPQEAPAAQPPNEFARTSEQLSAEFKEKIIVYVDLRIIRDNIKKIVQIYDKAIARCYPTTSYWLTKVPYSLDIGTLKVLQDLKLLNIEVAKSAYDKVFTTDVNQLRDQRDKMDKIRKEILAVLPNLRRSLEPLGILGSEDHGYGVPVIFNYYTGRTPYVNAAVNARLLALGLPVQSNGDEDK